MGERRRQRRWDNAGVGLLRDAGVLGGADARRELRRSPAPKGGLPLGLHPLRDDRKEEKGSHQVVDGVEGFVKDEVKRAVLRHGGLDWLGGGNSGGVAQAISNKSGGEVEQLWGRLEWHRGGGCRSAVLGVEGLGEGDKAVERLQGQGRKGKLGRKEGSCRGGRSSASSWVIRSSCTT